MVEPSDGRDDDPAKRLMFGTAVVEERRKRLIDAGMNRFHIYTLNRSDVSLALCRARGPLGSARATSVA